MKILLTEGSGITSRQVAGRLAAMGHHVDVLTSDPLCLCRFTRHVRRLHRVPLYGHGPFAWLDAALAVYEAGAFDVLFPTQEQVAVLAAAGVGTAVPSFAALAAVQDKVAAFATLTRLGLPQPPAAVVTSDDDLQGWRDLPAYVKQPIGTATTGVRKVETVADLAAVDVGACVLVQRAVDGPLAMVQSVFDGGELVASHANLRVRLGANGGASHKRGIDHDQIRAHFVTLGADLGWHGALSADVILTADGPVFIDLNPRLVEPVNAWRSGVDLVGALLEVACGRTPAPQPPGPPGQRTHQTVLAVLGAAQAGRAGRHRRRAHRRRPPHRRLQGQRRRDDPVARRPASGRSPRRGGGRHAGASGLVGVVRSGSVAAYALTPAAWAEIHANPHSVRDRSC